MTEFTNRLQQIEQDIKLWWSTPRWEDIHRPYQAKDVATFRNSINIKYPANEMSKKLWNLLKDLQAVNSFSQTFGVLDPVQAANLAKYLKTIYISGWQCSSTASVTNEPGPDFADYPYNTVPTKVAQIFKSLVFHDLKQKEQRSRMSQEARKNSPQIDYLVPIIADADTGFGGTTTVMKLVKLFIEAGAAGIHIEDQKPGVKKCGHMGGKVLVATKEQVNRLIAARLQADIMGSELVVAARTDALSAKYLDTNIDPIDHPYILGCVDPNNQQNLKTFPNAGIDAINLQFTGNKREEILNIWKNKCYNISLKQAQKLSEELGFSFYFDWEAPRSDEGYYLVDGSIDFCVARCREFGRYSDMFWMETPTPDLKVAEEFSRKIKKYHPKKLLSYNLSPSFNWDVFGMTDLQIQNFCSELGKLGYTWQFITLAGFHMNALISEKFSRDFPKNLMLTYVNNIQRKETQHNVSQLTHQKWSGAELADYLLSLTESKTSNYSTSEDSTENQFTIQIQAKPRSKL